MQELSIFWKTIIIIIACLSAFGWCMHAWNMSKRMRKEEKEESIDLKYNNNNLQYDDLNDYHIIDDE